MSLWRVLTCAGILGIAGVAVAASKPNILVILADDGGMNMQGFNAQLHGSTTQFLTPNLDALAAQSVVARQGYTSSSVCGPSRVGLLTGMYPQRLGLEHNIGQDNSQPWGYAPGQQLISTRLKDLGYTTGMVGKWHGGYVDGVNQPNDQGFDEFFGFLSGTRSYWTDAQPYNRMMRNKTNVETVWRTEGDRSQYDPWVGRYATDAFSEESEDFIVRHAQDEQPFFLYTSFTAPHTPLHAKSADLALFSGISDPNQRTLAAMNYAMDRGVGRILGALDAQGIRDNTLVVFLNDNGGAELNNAPFAGEKGTFFEGGIRTPIVLNGPGIAPGVYDQPISMYDILPTAVALAGGTTDPAEMAGVDLMPYLSGQQAEGPHEVMHWRYETTWAVRKRDWKLAKTNVNTPLSLVNLADDADESTNVINSQPAKRDELLRELTYWEATLVKPLFGPNGVLTRNQFDHFVFRPDLGVSQWHGASVWYQAGTTQAATMLQNDGYANAVMEFPTHNDANYAANNAFTRLSGQTFMINELRMTGAFNSAVPHSAALNGNPLLFVKSLNGNGPKIRCDATLAPGSAGYLFTLTEQVQMLDDLEITGNGTSAFAFNNVFQDYYEPRNLTKSGTSIVTFNGLSTYKGATIVKQGEVKFASSLAGLDGTSRVTVQNGGRIRMERGLINTQLVEIQSGGVFQMFGGRVQTDAVIGNLSNLGATFAGAANPGPISMTGAYSQNAASKMELRIGRQNGANVFDRVVATGSVQLAGSLTVTHVDLGSGLFEPSGLDNFVLISAAGGVSGTFSSVSFPQIYSPNLAWSLIYQPQSVTLRVVVNPSTIFTPANGIDAIDLFVIKSHFGMTNATLAQGDANGDTIVDGNDLMYWQRLYGSPPSGGGVASVPEGTTSGLLVTAAVCASARRRGRRNVATRGR